MINAVSMIGQLPETLGMLSEPIGNSGGPLELNQALLDSLDFAISPDDTESLGAQMLYMQVSIQITSLTQTSVPESGAFSPLDFSPEATASRIYEFSVSMFAVYRAQNPDEASETALASYEQLARDAIDEGFKEAGKILGDLGKLDASMNEFVDTTHSILQQLLDGFFLLDEAGRLEAAESASTSWTQFDLEYEAFLLEAVLVPGEDAGAALDAGMPLNGDGVLANTDTFMYRLYAESMSLSLSYAQADYGPQVEFFA